MFERNRRSSKRIKRTKWGVYRGGRGGFKL